MEHSMNHFERAARICVSALAVLLPWWFIPLPVGVEFGREVTFGILITLAAISWFLAGVTGGEIRYRHSSAIWAGLATLVVFGVSTIFSKAPMVSAFFAENAADTFSVLVLGLVLVGLCIAIFRSSQDIALPLILLIFSGAIAAFIGLLQYFGFSPYQFSFISAYLPFLAPNHFNVVGTLNGMTLFYTVLFVMTLGLLLAPEVAVWKRNMKIALVSSAAVFAAHIVLVHFRISWIVLLGVGVFLFGLLVRHMRHGAGEERPAGFGWKQWVALGMLVISILMLMIENPLASVIGVIPEVSPSFGATIKTAGSVFQAGVKEAVFGVGPGLFGVSWAQFKDPSINQTIFWNARFTDGFSWISTLPATVGIAGALAFLAFIGAIACISLRSLLLSRENILGTSLFLGFTALALSAFLYPANLSLTFLFFLVSGLLLASLASHEGGWIWAVEERHVRFEAPWAMFLSSLAFIFLVAIFVAAFYAQTTRLRAAYLQYAGGREFQKGNIDGAIEQYAKAGRIEKKNYRNYQAMVPLRAEKIRSLIGQAASGQNVQQEFQSAVSSAIGDAQQAVGLYPHDPSLWEQQGGIYELIIPFIQGSERFAIDSYRKALELDPRNPSYYIDLGRAGLVFADRLQLALNQASEGEREQLEKERLAALQEAILSLESAAKLKSDLAAAHFLLAQTALRLGNIPGAIQSTENAKIAAPFDVGIAFQLGLLYYQRNDLNRAQAEFERAISLNQNYSNARYFLGLIYSRKGKRDHAIAEFEKILVFNPDNEEVKKILKNLRAGNAALFGIVPPEEAPEKRKEAPVKEMR